MRLICLSANRESFKSVKFNENGLTLIVGSKTQEGQTYNGVGKSLIVALLHFCLGSSKNGEFEAKIPQWEFTLEFELQGQRHRVSRNTSKQSIMLLDNVEKNVTTFNSWMEDRLFSIPDDVKSLTYRSLLPKFMRRGQKEYVEPLETSDRSDYDMLVRNAFLLGLEVHLVARKAELRDELMHVQQLRNNFKTDQLLRDFYAGGKDAAIHLGHLETQIKRLEQDREKFVVAENYYDLQKAADELAEQIANDTNTAFLFRSAVENINKSLKEQPDVPLARLQALYGELTQAFKPESLKRLEDLSDFHRRLLTNRVARLSREKLRVMEQLTQLEVTLRVKQATLDRHLQTLGQANALDQYTALVNQIAELTAQAQKLRDYQDIDREYSNNEAVLKGKMSDEVIATNAYLEETRAVRDEKTGVFKEYVARFYPNKVAGISVNNNDGDNKTRFDLAVQIEDDSSDGINEVRIFCYDLSILSLKQGHKVGYVFHDSRLFANMDVRQRAELFKLADEVTSRLGCQYIATLNPDFISGMESEFTDDEFRRIFTDNIVLTLKDDSPAGKLLGIQVDMHYDKK
jgi:uncharacterized protein YydD (DUF2326 family)